MTGPTCATPGCGQPARARIVTPLLTGTTAGNTAFTIIRPLNSPVTGEYGTATITCLDCAHAEVDDMLMAATPPADMPPEGPGQP